MSFLWWKRQIDASHMSLCSPKTSLATNGSEQLGNLSFLTFCPPNPVNRCECTLLKTLVLIGQLPTWRIGFPERQEPAGPSQHALLLAPQPRCPSLRSIIDRLASHLIQLAWFGSNLTHHCGSHPSKHDQLYGGDLMGITNLSAHSFPVAARYWGLSPPDWEAQAGGQIRGGLSPSWAVSLNEGEVARSKPDLIFDWWQDGTWGRFVLPGHFDLRGHWSWGGPAISFISSSMQNSRLEEKQAPWWWPIVRQPWWRCCCYYC